MSARRKTPTADENIDPTVVDGPLAQSLVDGPDPVTGATTIMDPPASPPTAIQVISKMDQAQPIQAISMKTPDGQAARPAQANPPTPMIARPKLRAIAEVTPAKQQNLGNLASPYDPKEARARAVREYVIWGCLAVILASAIALVVWFAAR